MSIVQAPIVVADFREEDQAIRSIDDLTRMGFSNDQIMIVMPGEELAIGRLLDNLEKVGMPEDELNYCKRKFEAGNILIAVTHDGRHWETASILYGSRIHKYFRRLKGHKGAFPILSLDGLLEDLPFQMLNEKKSSE